MRKPLHELNIHDFFHYSRGKNNNITDVSGIKVGHSTIIKGENVRTGVTTVIAEGVFENDLAAGGFAFNANGEFTGLQYVFEEGKLYCPIFLTNTISLSDVCTYVIDYYKPKLALPLIGECWDGWLNDIWGRHVKKENVIEAIESAKSGKVEQGCVGAGTGMTSFGFKSGIGTSSRKVKVLDKEYTVGILVNNNMGHEDGRHKYLRIAGIDYSKLFGIYEEEEKNDPGVRKNNSSIMIIATDAPLDHRQLNRLSKHAVFGFARAGLVSYTGSGDFVLAFSTGNRFPRRDTKVEYQATKLEETLMDDIFEATIEAVEESYLNSLLMAEDMKGRDGHFIKGLPVEKLLEKIR
ncbi:MAG TPA: P1 family peptidase [Patescibacteria group bacterium]|nr:P1 family peptidase [Patescibacteria group bacterium]